MRVAAYRARRPRRQDILVPRTLPAPVLGIDAINPANALDALHSFFAINVISGDRGLKARPGWAEHETNVGATAGDVRSLLPYHSSTGAVDRLFATAQNGIYDVTTSGSTPTLKHTFGTQNANSGYGEYLGFVNVASAHFLLYSDEVNGYLLYTESTDTWAAGSVTGVAAADLVSVMQWGSRVWFVERNSTRAWYLAPGAISGAATAFDFGPFFTTGGTLRALFRWTRDGGEGGMADFLVAVSSSGDVVVFGGTDPAFASTFGWLGHWNVGGVPAGRRLASPYGGDIQLLTIHGLLPLSRLVSGQVVTPDTYETNAIRPLFADAMSRMSTLPGWHVSTHPRGAFLVVNTPGVAGEPQEQFIMSFATRGWSRFRGLDMLCSAVWQNEFYFGTRDGRVLHSTGTVDNVGLGGDTTNAEPIECTVLGGFTTFGTLSRKAVRVYRPIFLTHGLAPAFQAFVKYDYDVAEPSGSLAQQAVQSGAWDSGAWDSALWGGLFGNTYKRSGVSGIGTAVAVGVRFAATDYAVLVGYDIAYEQGSML